jgi:hypothetical protein
MTSTKQKLNMILLYEQNKNKMMLLQENITKNYVEHTKGNGESYIYLCPLGI